MKKTGILFILVVAVTGLSFSQTKTDSIVRFSELRFHSSFEKEAFVNFIRHDRDTFQLFLAIDSRMTPETAKSDFNLYNGVYDQLNGQNFQSKKLNGQIKLCYSTVHDRFLKKYNDNVLFPEIFQTGTYNCLTASMLYSMVFDAMKIPYKVMAAPGHIYLIANPGSNSIVIETTNPGFEKAIFTGEFKQQFVNYLRSSKLISEEEYKHKSVEEIFEEKFNEVNPASFRDLPGFQYYNSALAMFQDNNFDEAVQLCQKAYFFSQIQQIKILLYNALVFEVEKSRFDKVSDMDYLAELSRFENVSRESIAGIFGNIINHYLQFTDKDAYCDSLNQRLLSGLTDKNVREEINFSYNMQMSYHYQNSEKVEKYIAKALEIKGNHRDAQLIMENYLKQKFFMIRDPRAMLDTAIQLEKRYTFQAIAPMIKDLKLTAYLTVANDLCGEGKVAEADKYILNFESNCVPPVKNQSLESITQATYRSMAVYYFNKGNKVKSKNYVDRGLKYVPSGKFLPPEAFQ
jgi:tetratricopeptide (TPR) repeat protein